MQSLIETNGIKRYEMNISYFMTMISLVIVLISCIV